MKRQPRAVTSKTKHASKDIVNEGSEPSEPINLQKQLCRTNAEWAAKEGINGKHASVRVLNIINHQRNGPKPQNGHQDKNNKRWWCWWNKLLALLMACALIQPLSGCAWRFLRKIQNGNADVPKVILLRYISSKVAATGTEKVSAQSYVYWWIFLTRRYKKQPTVGTTDE